MSSTENSYSETDLGNVSPNPRGEYDPETAYEYLDLVNYKGGSYLCLVDLGTTVTGVAPAHGKNTDTWQLLTLPGDLTPEYIAMHDDVVNKAEQVEASRAAVEQSQEEIEAAQADVQQLHSDTVEAAQEASDSRDSAAGYAQAAETSRQAASESEKNVNAQVSGFDTHVAEKITEATQDIESARQTAVSAVTSQQETSVQAIAAEGEKATESIKTGAETVANDRQAVEEAAQTAAAQAQEVAQNAQTVAANTESATKSAESAQTSAENAAKSAESVQAAVDQIAKNTQDVASLKKDLSNKITKFYASNQGETHLADSDNGKIQDMVLYGKSEQNQYKGINLLPTDIAYEDIIEVSIPKGTHLFWITDGTPSSGGNFKFYNEDKTQEAWFGIDAGKTAMTRTLNIDAKYMQFLVSKDQSVKMCLGIGDDPVYEPYTGGQPSPSPDYPQEIKSVVNPTVKICGKNLLPFPYADSSGTRNGVTFDVRNDGTIHIYGTAAVDTYFNLSKDIEWNDRSFSDTGNGLKLIGNLGYNSVNKFLSHVVKQGVTVDYLLKPMVVSEDTTDLTYEPYHEQTVTLPYTLNAIPVSSGGNVTIGGQQYIADYVDGERGKLVRCVDSIEITGDENWELGYDTWKTYPHCVRCDNINNNIQRGNCLCEKYLTHNKQANNDVNSVSTLYERNISISDDRFSTAEEFKNEFKRLHNAGAPIAVYYVMKTPTETDLTPEELAAFKALATYYSATNISVNSDQLDGYTIFNYPISMAQGWDYVKKQLNDNRDYIYNMNLESKDIDTQSAEAYVNSEYAVALTELEV